MHKVLSRFLAPYLLCISALSLLSACANAADANGSAASSERPVVQVQTNLGGFAIELQPQQAPVTVANFLARVDEQFYDGLIFHRVIPNFMIQAGGYDADLTYSEPPATVVNESHNGLRNRKATVAMARLNDPDSASTQFFINVKDNRHLDPQRGRPGYTVFGQVVDGWDTVVQIELVDTGRRDGMAGVPEKPVIIESIRRQ
ncbi:MAG: peptidylprolyl isomerase [Pseudomonadales bacterium]